MDPLIEVDETAQVRSITLNRPDRLNALNGAVLDHLADEIRRVTEETTAVRCLVIRGAGDRAFESPAPTSRRSEASTPTKRMPSSVGDTAP